ncbi:MAG: hypothetical protein PHX39_00725 [Bacteroidales bacterium]|jgi:hypothetical protein|nr:hypothetical protein [Bacteroidales bacterium]MDD3130262.1 hypothetical protein [Bacteroidales bacterium]MDD3525463.1 hypothetical protein [Bacteroidales bacterium]NCU35564.1 hypothetical protein [Candidatus Falkowbacteria bacterium]
MKIFGNINLSNPDSPMKLVVLIISVLVINSCSSVQKNQISAEAKEIDKNKVMLNFKEGPQTFIYKTKHDYTKFVPILLSDDKSEIVSYPHPRDVFYKGDLAYPTELKGGYLLDNRGINSNVAFLNITYEDYSKLESAPPLEELEAMILDKNPLVEMYNCGNRFTFKNGASDLNKLIENNGLEDCKCLVKE